jgi:hypothetical protein
MLAIGMSVSSEKKGRTAMWATWTRVWLEGPWKCYAQRVGDAGVGRCVYV